MSRKCVLTGKHRQSGHNVSHANNKTKRVFMANVQSKRIFVAELGKMVRIKVSTSGLRTIDKVGLMAALKNNGLTLQDVLA